MSNTETPSPDGLEAVVREVTEQREVDTAAATLLGSIGQRLRDIADDISTAPEPAPDDPTVAEQVNQKLLDLAAELDAGQAELTAAIVANTPASPEAQAQTAEDHATEVADLQAQVEAAQAATGVVAGDTPAAEAPAEQVATDPPAGEWDTSDVPEGGTEEAAEVPAPAPADETVTEAATPAE